MQISDFDHHLDVLENVIEEYKDSSEVIIMGDYNCHFGEEIGKRFWGTTTPNAKQFYKMLKRNSMCVVDKDNEICYGPKYSFHVDGVGETYIDHIAVSLTLLDSIQECCVLEDCLQNTSDHLALYLSIDIMLYTKVGRV